MVCIRALFALALIALASAGETQKVQSKFGKALPELTQGFIEGLSSQNSQSSNCLKFWGETSQALEGLIEEMLLAKENVEHIFSAISLLRKFANSFNQELSSCRVYQLFKIAGSFLNPSDLGEYFLRYLTLKDVIDSNISQMRQFYGNSTYVEAGKKAGDTFSKLTNFNL